MASAVVRRLIAGAGDKVGSQINCLDDRELQREGHHSR